MRRLSALAVPGAILLRTLPMPDREISRPRNRRWEEGAHAIQGLGACAPERGTGGSGGGAPLVLQCICRAGNDLSCIAAIGWVLRQSSEQGQQTLPGRRAPRNSVTTT